MSYNITKNELYHWGIKNMKWGVRRYQNKDGTLTSTGRARKKKGVIESYKDKKKMKKLRQAKIAKQAERAEKERIINSGDKNQVQKISNKLTNEELERALNRIELTSKLSDYSTNSKHGTTKKTGMQYVENIDKTMKMVQSTANAGKAIMDFADAINKFSSKKND